jgi:hypothetical protein
MVALPAMTGGTDYPALRERIAELEAQAECERLRADALLALASDHDRWGLAEEADALWALARESRVRALRDTSRAAAARKRA